MYNFIFNFFYRYHKDRKSFGPRMNAALTVGITVVFQMFMIANIITFFTGVNLAGKPFSEDYFTNKLYLMPFAMAFLSLFVLYYTHKRAMTIVNKYPKSYKLLTMKNILLILLIMILPLVTGILFLNHRH